MKREYRIYGMIICIIILVSSMLIGSYYPSLQEVAYMLMSFAAGYALRETLKGDEEE
jgi:hypothetical protein